MKYVFFKRNQLHLFSRTLYFYFFRKIICLAIALSFFALKSESKNYHPSNPDFIMTISGVVKDTKGDPLGGVSVIVRGTVKGTSTGADGSFSIEANAGDVLEFTIVGYHKKIVTIEQNKNISVLMELEEAVGDEVVVVGYGTQAKKDLTGSIGVVSQSKMDNQATVGIGQNLQGKLAGVQVIQNNGTPYSGTQIRIRGTGSFGASSNPLVVIDGMITNDGLANLNPNDVENITVLKDAASAAIYGSRGANGVVIVTTKKGNFESPLKVNF